MSGSIWCAVTTYGDIAALAGSAYTARVVGGIAHTGDINLPRHRLVNRFGGLATGVFYMVVEEAQEQLLLQEGIRCTDLVVDNFKAIRWDPWR